MARNKSEQDISAKLREWISACPVISEPYHITVTVTTATHFHTVEYINNELIQEVHIDRGTQQK